MPRLSSSRRRRFDTEDAEDGDDDARNGVGSQTSDSSKRRRLDPASDSEGDAGPSAPAAGPANGLSNGDTMQDFQPGAIVRVTVQNFVTYEKADFFPGPHLNMVIGPNGTGKSSLVCAICLGLGYSPKHLGRAGSVKEFVKHGKDTATIETELQKKPGDRSNYVIKVQIRREQNSQKWWLNGKETSHKKIQELMRSLKIQVDNLCQFLPQDRVVEFAACTPVDLLHETLRAAAPEEMLLWQGQLQEMHREKKELANAVHVDADALKTMENRQQGLQADVDRIREREEIQEKVRDLQAALVLARYTEARDNHGKARERKKEAERALRLLESESGPSLEAVNMKQEYAHQIEAVIPVKEKAVKDAEHAAQDAAREITAAAELAKEMNNRLDAERKGFESKRKDLAASRSKITAFQADLRNRPADFNAGDWNQKIRAEEHKMREMESEHRQISSDRDATKEHAKRLNVDISTIKAELDAFDTQQGQQISFMRKYFPEASTGWEWIKEHQGEFEKEVFGPPMISCSVKDERYTDQIQALLQIDDLVCFTAQTKNDYKKLTNQLYRVLSLSVVVRTCSSPLSAFQAPVDGAELTQLGLDGFAIDCLDGPEPVLAMLCAEKRLHMSGVALEDHNEQAYDRLINNGKINQWAAGRQTFTVRRRREYGPQAMTTITKNIPNGRFWTSQPVDMQEKKDLERRLAEVHSEKGILKEEHDKLKERLDGIEEKKKEITDKIAELRREKSALQKEFQKWQSLPVKIGWEESEERQKAMHEEALREARKNMQETQYEWDKAVVKRAKLVISHKKLADKIREAHLSLVEAKIWLMEANSDVEGLKERNASIMGQLEEERRNVRAAAEETNRTKDIGRRLGETVRELLARDEARREVYGQLADGKSPHEVEMEIGAEEAKLELIHDANPNVIREFERRAEEIARLKRKMEGANEKLEALNAQLGRVMSKWEPRLEELVSQINDAFAYNFEQISCAGEVRVHKEDDFSQWALDIMVKFRENEALQQLTAHRQSGGERAVSTIFYLMALQSLAQSPFRVVDEINQGMDPRNERMVHERMVEIACREHTSQYFLITPKLLTGLRYDAKMRVLCIASGEYMPKEGRKVDFATCLKIQRRLTAAGG
ncbi:structural maintenance of chromosomes 5 smc5 [Metarhizium album ARSEF 1941]|uniref:Structural maintenance of chromosomes protein 5 n=1 Tax=Metarhizium album (strain ARSEF 1941) TaxID=1081103 RepID=A0A0B2WRX2_METAS|nr:structural maintenance of chromosomes 5 smc5 [Metarhizium album ARSEF 1941]KHN98811.1 structural maintenance of chromosomes 5 smc5 [Metarhizium album ARSEF 1941]